MNKSLIIILLIIASLIVLRLLFGIIGFMLFKVGLIPISIFLIYISATYYINKTNKRNGFK